MIKKRGGIMIFQEFYQALYPILFYQWISLNHSTYQSDHVFFEKSHSDQYSRILTFQMTKVIGKIVIWDNSIVEEEIQRIDGEQLFYFHYNIVELSQACQLFQEFYKTLIQHNQQKNIKIAICCTGGLSTAVFADEIQEACQMGNIPFSIHSLSLDELEHQYQDYDAIYLAPQIAPIQSQLLNQYHKPIYCIDATDFATKNFHTILQTMKNDLQK